MRRLAFACLAVASVGAMAAGGMSFEYQAIERKHPFSNTALLFAVDDHNLEFQHSNIRKIDGKYAAAARLHRALQARERRAETDRRRPR
jgi:hypothetical protein